MPPEQTCFFFPWRSLSSPSQSFVAAVVRKSAKNNELALVSWRAWVQLFRLIVMKLGLVVMHQCVSMLGVLSSKRRCFAYAVALMGLGAMGWAGWLTEPLQLGWEWAVYACNAMATVVGNVWYTVVWEPAMCVSVPPPPLS